ncbi:hypothetical protein OPV22_031479 [Ensete ventricosum]|uniref:Uncharacterized protein n=1 Tax=Ensete ventricosum TaxID=4639 RepID=A0AAV8PVI4_ENSVE|nr:hypothetical protein OPV22_031479 [Ensete ventricosum]
MAVLIDDLTLSRFALWYFTIRPSRAGRYKHEQSLEEDNNLARTHLFLTSSGGGGGAVEADTWNLKGSARRRLAVLRASDNLYVACKKKNLPPEAMERAAHDQETYGFQGPTRLSPLSPGQPVDRQPRAHRCAWLPFLVLRPT